MGVDNDRWQQMNWNAHRRWARKLGINDTVADYVNRVIDSSEENDLPTESLEALQRSADTLARERGAKRGNSGLGLVIAKDAMETHDAGRRKPTRGSLAAACNLRHLRSKGEDYVQAWYLHHHLDYLHEHRSAEADLGDLISDHKEEYPDTHSIEIEQFLLDNQDKLAAELNK